MEKKKNDTLNGTVATESHIKSGSFTTKLPGVDRSKVISSSPMIIKENSSKKR